jgi:hypothetical protein
MTENTDGSFSEKKFYDAIKGGFDATGVACVKYVNEATGIGKYGYIDTLGNFVLEPRYIEAWNFSNGLAFATQKNNVTLIKGYINRKGIFVWSSL